MRKLIKVFLALVVGVVSTVAFSSCINDAPVQTSQICAKQDIPENPYHISQDQAIQNLQDFGSAFYDSDSRTIGIPVISEVLPCRILSAQSRSAVEDSIINDIMLYFINFDNNEGFAVVSGDIRIPETVLCLTSYGRITPKELGATGMVDGNGNVINFNNPEYPTTGATFFTDSKYPGELFLNPNIGDLYVEDENDTLIGNYESEIIENEGDSTTHELDSTLNFEPGYFVAKICLDYAEKIINDGPQHFRWNDDKYTGLIGNNGGGGTMPISHDESVYTDWSVISQKSPMLTNYIAWHQSAPFNNLYPKRRALLLFGAQRRAPAGCFPLAISKIMAYFQFPGNITYNSFTINWNSVNTTSVSPAGSRNKANLLYYIAEGCGCWYFYQGTFTFPSKALSFLRFNGFQSVNSVSYTTSDAIQMIDKGYPVIVYGIPGIKFWSAHAWNIDGYKIQTRTRTTTYYNGSNVVKRESVEETQKMVHCDFGWGGNCNGYFCGSIFDLKAASTEFDDPNKSNEGEAKFGNYLHIVKYNLPK